MKQKIAIVHSLCVTFGILSEEKPLEPYALNSFIDMFTVTSWHYFLTYHPIDTILEFENFQERDIDVNAQQTTHA